MGFRARPGNGFDCTRERPAGALMGIMFSYVQISRLVAYIRNTLRRTTGQWPRPETPDRAGPKGPGAPEGDAPIVGYYVLVYADTTAQGGADGRGLRASGWG